MTSLPTPKRWIATANYRTDHGPTDVEHSFEELWELHDLIERGPNWDCLIDIRITLHPKRRTHDITVEQARRL